MKKLLILLLVLISFTYPISASAASVTSKATDEATDTGTAVLIIDTQNLYDGMNKTYAQGYSPTVENDSVRIVLPLLDKKAVLNGEPITVTPKVSEASSPLLISNRQFSVSKSTKPDYLIDFTVPLSKDRTNGKYSMVVQTEYIAGNSVVTQEFAVVIYITDGKNPDAASASETAQKPTSQPVLMVTGHVLTPATVNSGEEFTLTVKLKNTNESKGIQNVRVAVSTESPFLIMMNASNSFYYKSLAKNGTVELALKFKSALGTPAGKYSIGLDMAYDNSDAQALSATGLVTFQIGQPIRVEMELPRIPQEVTAGDTLPLAFHVMNLGRGKVYDMRVSLSAPGLLPNASAFIGNMEAGTAGDTNMNVFIGTKDMSAGFEGGDKYGYTDGRVKLIYEDESGKEYQQEFKISTAIKKPSAPETESNGEVSQPQKAGQWWISVVVAVVITLGIGAYIVIRKIRRGKPDEEV